MGNFKVTYNIENGGKRSHYIVECHTDIFEAEVVCGDHGHEDDRKWQHLPKKHIIWVIQVVLPYMIQVHHSNQLASVPLYAPFHNR